MSSSGLIMVMLVYGQVLMTIWFWSVEGTADVSASGAGGKRESGQSASWTLPGKKGRTMALYPSRLEASCPQRSWGPSIDTKSDEYG